MAFGVKSCCCDVGDMDRLLGPQHIANNVAGGRMKQTATTYLSEGRRHIVRRRDEAKPVSLIEK
jgi:hypothetical protein